MNNKNHFIFPSMLPNADVTEIWTILTGRQIVIGDWEWSAKILRLNQRNMNTMCLHKRPASRSNPCGHLMMYDMEPLCHHLAHQRGPTTQCCDLLSQIHTACQTAKKTNQNIYQVLLSFIRVIVYETRHIWVTVFRNLGSTHSELSLLLTFWYIIIANLFHNTVSHP
jgi:hypothetical protein